MQKTLADLVPKTEAEEEATFVRKARAKGYLCRKLNGEGFRGWPDQMTVSPLGNIKFIEFKRPGKAAGGGFYDYPANGKKQLWPELKARFEKADKQIPLEDVRDRILFIQAIETVRCVQERVLLSTADANIGSIFGIGFAAWTGGALQFINQYGLQSFVARAHYLAEQYGERFEPPALLLEKAAKGDLF